MGALKRTSASMTRPIRRALAALLTLTCLGAMSAHAAGVQGPVPPAFQNRFMVGLFEEAGQTWMRDSDVPWDARYRYFTKGWADNWGSGAHDGSWAASFFTETKAQGYVPVVTYYQLFGEPGGGEQETLAKLKNASTMRAYFEDVKLLLQRAKTFGGPVVVHVEPDAVGFLQFQTTSNPNAYAAIAASGMPELAGIDDARDRCLGEQPPSQGCRVAVRLGQCGLAEGAAGHGHEVGDDQLHRGIDRGRGHLRRLLHPPTCPST